MSDGVSCLCLTYGRVNLLEEAIESFLRQTWDGPKELIVVNDHPDQTLRCDAPDVYVVNLSRRIRSLGEKRNLSVALAKYDNLLVWDDDDIYLPWRIEETMKKLPKDQFFKCPNAWLMNDGKIDPEPSYNLFHGGSAFTRWLFDKVKGYPPINSGEDCEIEKRFQHITDTKGEFWPHTNLPKDRLYYIYRWHHGSYHTTGVTDLSKIDPKVEVGEVKLQPKWERDYVELAKVAAGVKVQPLVSSKLPIHFVVFSKNRPLQLDGYIRSLTRSLDGQSAKISVLYSTDPPYWEAYNELIRTHVNVNFMPQSHFHDNLTSIMDNTEFTCFGCDDVVYKDKIDFKTVVDVMRWELSFAFSFRLGKNIKHSMFSGPMVQPTFTQSDSFLSWDLHQSHGNGDFGYSWEFNGTVYPTDIAKQVIDAVKASSPNMLEANGGGKWSAMTNKRLMSCFKTSKLAVPTVNVVQTNFPNPVLGKPVSTQFLLDAWNCGMRLDVGRYATLQNDSIHVRELFLTNT